MAGLPTAPNWTRRRRSPPHVVWNALEGVEAVFHFAAAVGVGQSMYEIANYTAVNGVGTAVLLEALAKRPVERLVVASSMSIMEKGFTARQTEFVSKDASARSSSSRLASGNCVGPMAAR